MATGALPGCSTVAASWSLWVDSAIERPLSATSLRGGSWPQTVPHAADYLLHCGRADAPWRSLSVIIGDAAPAFRRIAPMAFAEASAHALVAHDAIDQVTAAAGQAYMHHLPRIRPPFFAGFRNQRSDVCGGNGSCCRWGRAYWRLPLTCACVLRGGSRRRALTRARALRRLGVGSENGRPDGDGCLGPHRLRLHRHRQGRSCCGYVVLTGTARLRGDSHRVGRRRIDAVCDIGTRDQDRRDDSQLAGPEQAPARSRHPGGERRLSHGCRYAHIAWRCPRRRRVGWQHWRCLGCSE